MAVPFEMRDFLFQTKYTGILALVRAFDRAIAQFTWPRVWPREPFGEGVRGQLHFWLHVEVGGKY